MWTRTGAVVFLLGLSVTVCFAGKTPPCCNGGQECHERANELIFLADSVNSGYEHFEGPSAQEWYKENDVPRALLTRDQIVTYLYLEALRIDPEGTANYYLGYYLIEKDCAASRYYFERHLRIYPGQSETTVLLNSIDECGCECTVERLLKRELHWE